MKESVELVQASDLSKVTCFRHVTPERGPRSDLSFSGGTPRSVNSARLTVTISDVRGAKKLKTPIPKRFGCCLKCKQEQNVVIHKSHKLTFHPQ